MHPSNNDAKQTRTDASTAVNIGGEPTVPPASASSSTPQTLLKQSPPRKVASDNVANDDYLSRSQNRNHNHSNPPPPPPPPLTNTFTPICIVRRASFFSKLLTVCVGLLFLMAVGTFLAGDMAIVINYESSSMSNQSLSSGLLHQLAGNGNQSLHYHHFTFSFVEETFCWGNSTFRSPTQRHSLADMSCRPLAHQLGKGRVYYMTGIIASAACLVLALLVCISDEWGLLRRLSDVPDAAVLRKVREADPDSFVAAKKRSRLQSVVDPSSSPSPRSSLSRRGDGSLATASSNADTSKKTNMSKNNINDHRAAGNANNDASIQQPLMEDAEESHVREKEEGGDAAKAGGRGVVASDTTTVASHPPSPSSFKHVSLSQAIAMQQIKEAAGGSGPNECVRLLIITGVFIAGIVATVSGIFITILIRSMYTNANFRSDSRYPKLTPEEIAYCSFGSGSGYDDAGGGGGGAHSGGGDVSLEKAGATRGPSLTLAIAGAVAVSVASVLFILVSCMGRVLRKRRFALIAAEGEAIDGSSLSLQFDRGGGGGHHHHQVGVGRRSSFASSLNTIVSANASTLDR